MRMSDRRRRELQAKAEGFLAALAAQPVPAFLHARAESDDVIKLLLLYRDLAENFAKAFLAVCNRL